MWGALAQLMLRIWRTGRDRAVGGWRMICGEGPGQVQFWLIALCVGIVAGLAAVGFRLGISLLQSIVYGANDRMLATHLAGLHWSWVVLIPILGGLVVGLILDRFTPDGRVRSVGHVIEGAALREGRVEKGPGLASALASMITLSTGGSTGREGPVVHLGAVISSWVSDRIKADGVTGRDLLGCAAAAAVSASFNAPIAGALFALEVILRHFAVHAFAPIVIASVAGTVIGRLLVGDVTEFSLPDPTLAFYVELPAFLILGLLSGVVAATLIFTLFIAEDVADVVQEQTRMRRWARPAISGAMLGVIAVGFPHIIGVGYETTSRALTGQLTLADALVFAVVKVVAVAITVAGRMGGGVFSPSLMIGALTGLAFGHVATAIFPSTSGWVGLYALAGMGAVAAAVLGAPISTTLIVFELTGDWQAGIAVMVSVSLSCAISVRLVDRSYFLHQIERRGVHLAAGPQAYLPATIDVGAIMRMRGGDQSASDTMCQELMEQGVQLSRSDTLETALPMFERSGAAFLPVVEDGDLLGAVFHLDALKALNRALIATAHEEHS